MRREKKGARMEKWGAREGKIARRGSVCEKAKVEREKGKVGCGHEFEVS